MRLVTIIVPVYNVEKYLARCIRSIIHQSYHNLEIILVDDGSPDGCSKICDDYAARDARIRVVHQANGGLSAARNAGLDLATGEYICFVDSDDDINQDMVEKLIAPLEKDKEAIISLCGVQMETHMGEHVQCRFFPKTALMAELTIADYEKEMYLGRKIRTWMWNRMYRREAIGDLRFDTNLRKYEDIWFQHKMCRQIDGKVICIPDYCYHYRIRKDGLRGNHDQQLESFEQLAVFFSDGARECPELIVRMIRIYLSQLHIIAVGREGTDYGALDVTAVKRRNRQYILKYLNTPGVKHLLGRDTAIRCLALRIGFPIFQLLERII